MVSENMEFDQKKMMNSWDEPGELKTIICGREGMKLIIQIDEGIPLPGVRLKHVS